MHYLHHKVSPKARSTRVGENVLFLLGLLFQIGCFLKHFSYTASHETIYVVMSTFLLVLTHKQINTYTIYLLLEVAKNTL